MTLGRTHKFRASFVTFNYDAETIILRTITFQGRTFNIGAPGDRRHQVEAVQASATSGTSCRVERGFFGLIVGPEVQQGRGVDRQPGPDVGGDDGRHGAGTDPRRHRPRLPRAEPSRSPASSPASASPSTTIEVKFWDFDLYGTVSVGRNFGVQGGYRSVVVDYIVDEDTGDLKMKGPYFGAWCGSRLASAPRSTTSCRTGSSTRLRQRHFGAHERRQRRVHRRRGHGEILVAGGFAIAPQHRLRLPDRQHQRHQRPEEVADAVGFEARVANQAPPPSPAYSAAVRPTRRCDRLAGASSAVTFSTT